MKTLPIIIVILLFAACSQAPSSSEATVSDPSTALATTSPEEVTQDAPASSEDVVASAPLPEAPKPSEKRKANEVKQASKSVFLGLGCCTREESRSDDCCCVAVLEKYKELVAGQDSKLAEYKTKDPILGNCRRKMAKEFELVDYPVEEGEMMEDEDDGAF